MKNLKLLFVCILIYANSFSQPWIPNEYLGDGQYWEYDAINYQNYPYTTFNRVNGVSVAKQIQNIKDLINADRVKNPKGEFYRLYRELWDFAWGARPAVGGDPSKEPSQLPAWAKAHAFIYLMNMDLDGNTMNSNDRESIGWTAEKALQDMNTEVSWWKYDKLLGRSRELIAAVQAYDLLKAGGRLNGDRNKDDLTSRDNLRKFARNIFNEANDRFGVLQNPIGYKKNHGISTAAALGIMAIVFNECGAGYFYDGWKAKNWGRLGHWGMAECLFDAGDFSVSQRGGIY